MDCLAKLCRGTPVSIAPGIHFDLNREVYDNIPALSASVLKKWLSLRDVRSEFAHWLRNRWSAPASEYLVHGRALDCLLLEPQRFNERFVILPADAPRKPTATQRNAKKPSDSTLDAIAWWEKFTKQAEGKTELTVAQHLACQLMMQALQRAPAAQGVFEHCRKAALVGELWGIPAKAEIDLWNNRIAHIVDLKSAADVRPDAFLYAIKRFQYLEQAVFYLSLAEALGFEKDVFTWLAVRNSEPWTVRVYNFGPAAVPEHRIIGGAVREALAAAAVELCERLENDNFADEPDWEFVRFPDWQVRAAEFGGTYPRPAWT